MSFQIFTDSSANLFEDEVNRLGLKIVSLTLSINEDEVLCYGPGAPFDFDAFFKRMREDGTLVLKTSMINTSAFLAAFEPVLQAEMDVLCLTMSSGLSGTWSGGQKAADILQKKYPEREIRVVDTLSATIGEGLLVREAVEMRNGGKTVSEIAAYIEQRKTQLRQFFMVDDLNFLRRGGRLSGSAALAGSIMHLKPILKGDEEGKIVLDRKLFGRKKALATLVEVFSELHGERTENRRFGVSHTGAEEEAHLLAAQIIDRYPGAGADIVPFEPCTASHVGPGAVGLFFF
jgi:DegV family protein with EDD domain